MDLVTVLNLYPVKKAPIIYVCMCLCIYVELYIDRADD